MSVGLRQGIGITLQLLKSRCGALTRCVSTIEHRLLQRIALIGAEMTHQRLEVWWQSQILGVRQRATRDAGVEFVSRCEVVDGQPPGAPAVDHGDPARPLGLCMAEACQLRESWI